MPRTTRDDVTVDLLDRGYDQRLRVENTSLNVYDSPAHGGGLLTSIATDLAPPPPSVEYGNSGCESNCPADANPCDSPGICYANTWATYGRQGNQACGNCFNVLWNAYHVNTVYLATNGQTLYMAGTQGISIDGFNGDPVYQNLLYAVPLNGANTCATYQCAQDSGYATPGTGLASLPYKYYPYVYGAPGENRYISVTSLAAGFSGGNAMIAVGLSDGGVQIYSGTNANGTLTLTDTFQGMATGDGSQTPPTALAWDPAGSGNLAIGVISWGNVGYIVNVNGQGKIQGNTLTWSVQGGDALVPAPFSTAFGQSDTGDLLAAFGMREGDGSGTLRLVDTTTNGTTAPTLTSTTPGVDAVEIAINPIPRLDGTTGGSDYAVTYQGANSAAGVGGSWRRDVKSGELAKQVVAIGSATETADFPTFRAWYPGVKEGRLQIQNTSGEPITVALQQSPLPAYGCWWAPAWADAGAFPSPLSLTAGQTSATYTIGAFSAGSKGGCAATDETGQWAGYLVITPTNHPADVRVVDMTMTGATVDVSGQVAQPAQAGGAINVTIAQNSASPGAFGTWTLSVTTAAAPTPAPTPPTVKATLLTPQDTPAAPVYRFDVSGATLQLPAATVQPGSVSQLSTQVPAVPPLVVQGSVNGQTWTPLGTLVPRSAPTISAGSPAVMTLGPATLWWEVPATPNAYKFVQVGLGPSGPTTTVTLASVTAPPDLTLKGPQLSYNNGANATPVDSGLDEAPLLLQIQDANSNYLPTTSAAYQQAAARVYYRDQNNALITNLFLNGAAPGTFIGVSPYPGAYPNNGSVTGGSPTNSDGYAYVATTNSTLQPVTAYMAVNSNAPASGGTPPNVQALNLSPGVSADSAAGGISLVGCQDFSPGGPCPLYPIVTSTSTTSGSPAPYLDTTNGIAYGILTAAQVTTLGSSLPLQQTAGSTTRHEPATEPLVFTNSTTAVLQATSSYWPTDEVETYLVTHGLLSRMISLPVQAN